MCVFMVCIGKLYFFRTLPVNTFFLMIKIIRSLAGDSGFVWVGGVRAFFL